MYPAGPTDTILRFYRSRREPVTGVWSVLLTKNPRDSADFAQRYLDTFNRVSLHDWHLGVFAARSRKGAWFVPDGLSRMQQVLQEALIKAGHKVPDNCLVFFDPNALGPQERALTIENIPEGAFSETCLVIPFDLDRIASAAVMEAGFERIHAAIRRVFRRNGLDAHSVIGSGQMPVILREIESELKTASVFAVLATLPGIILGTLADRMLDAAGGL